PYRPAPGHRAAGKDKSECRARTGGRDLPFPIRRLSESVSPAQANPRNRCDHTLRLFRPLLPLRGEALGMTLPDPCDFGEPVYLFPSLSRSCVFEAKKPWSVFLSDGLGTLQTDAWFTERGMLLPAFGAIYLI